MEEFNDKYKKKNPFSVPEGYFDTLNDKITERIKAEGKPQKIRLIQMLKPYLGLAAVFLIALFVVQVIFPHIVDKKRMLVRTGETGIVATVVKEDAEEMEFAPYFEPTNDEIIEYLEMEVSDYELLFADLYGR